ncbi:E1 [Duck papillomavirus 3]|uniref:DNA 3'-5' helicase n=1 Tax=Duck papillomavirus 3 TaxID=2562546 RepID=A0AAE5YN31_9PAPI|nr:E1 [Duck papillomavirus 3]
MEFILTEAEEVDASENGRDSAEEEDEDTGIDTYYTQLFEEDTSSSHGAAGRGSSPSTSPSSPESPSLHRRLLLHLQSAAAGSPDDRENCPPGSGGLVCTPHPGGELPAADPPKHFRKHVLPGVHRKRPAVLSQPLCLGNAAIPTKQQRLHEDKSAERCTRTPSPEAWRSPQPSSCGRSPRAPLRPLLSNNGIPTTTHTVHEAGGIYARKTPTRAVCPASTKPTEVGENAREGKERPGSRSREEETEACSQRKTLGEELLQRCLAAKNLRSTQLAVFKEIYTASFTEITRAFKSDRTQSYEWVFLLLGAACITYEALRECLKAHTEFILTDTEPQKRLGVFYCGFHAAKNRDGLRRLLKNCNVDPACLVLAEPPNKRSVLASLFYQKMWLCHGEIPMWCRDAVAMGQLSGEDSFELSKMVQWALDNGMHDEGSIAYNYARHAETDQNAQLWLKSNSQAKYVRDAAAMVRHYQRGRLHATPMNEHIASRMRDYCDEDEDGWKRIIVFLRYQHVLMLDFLQTLRYWLNNRPKKSTIAIVGVPDSGKSMFSMSLCNFIEGRVLSFTNSRSQFWLQPLAECKAAVIDDVTRPCWDYLDTYMRNALDGNPICIDCKHRAPVQIKCPPILITSNYDPREIKTYDGGELQYKYLLSRISFLSFNRPIPVVGERPRFLVRTGDWRSFFLKYNTELGLGLEQFDYGDPEEGWVNTGGADGATPEQGGRSTGE